VLLVYWEKLARGGRGGHSSDLACSDSPSGINQGGMCPGVLQGSGGLRGEVVCHRAPVVPRSSLGVLGL
jgi:hypothetical protein